MVYAEPIKTNGRAYNVSPVVLSWYAWFPTDAYYIYSPNNMDGQMQNCKAQMCVFLWHLTFAVLKNLNY